MAPATEDTASSWPTTRSCSFSSRSTSFAISPCIIFCTGMPVQVDTTSAISSSDTSSFKMAPSCCFTFNASSAACRRRCRSGMRA